MMDDDRFETLVKFLRAYRNSEDPVPTTVRMAIDHAIAEMLENRADTKVLREQTAEMFRLMTIDMASMRALCAVTSAGTLQGRKYVPDAIRALRAEYVFSMLPNDSTLTVRDMKTFVDLFAAMGGT